MKNQIILLILSSLLFFSCKQSIIEQNLTLKNSVWYIFDYDSVSKRYKNLNYGYIFKSNGECDYVYYDFSENKLASYLGEMSRDIVVNKSWKYNKNNGEIRILFYKYKIVKYKNDTIYMKFKNRKYEILVNLGKKNPKSLTVMEFR